MMNWRFYSHDFILLREMRAKSVHSDGNTDAARALAAKVFLAIFLVDTKVVLGLDLH